MIREALMLIVAGVGLTVFVVVGYVAYDVFINDRGPDMSGGTFEDSRHHEVEDPDTTRGF